MTDGVPLDGIDALLVPARVHGRVLLRRTRGAARGVLAGFHGYAEDAAAQMERLAAVPGSAEWTIVSVQALHRFYRGRTDRTVASWMTREDRLAAIADNIAYVDAALAAADPEAKGALVLAGFSQGVAMAFRAAVRGRRRASAVVAVGGDVPPELLEDPAAEMPDVLLARGETDEWYTAAKMAHDAAALTARGVNLRTCVFPGGHEWHPAVAAFAGQALAPVIP